MAATATLRRYLRACVWLLLGAAAAAGCAPAIRAQPAQPAPRVYLTDVNGIIGVATARQIARAIDKARAEKANALIVRLDTPGGLVSSTREIIKAMVASPVPIIVYVAPSGARAASAGTYITYASNIAAMAPGTNIGAATPVELGGLPGTPQPKEQPKEKDKKSDTGTTAPQRKAINDMVAMLRSLAQLRSRNAEWAEKAVRDAATLTASEALKENVIEIIAGSVDDLLAQADGRKVTVDNKEVTLATKGATIVTYEPDWRTRALSAIADPNIAFLLLMIGFYGILLEFWHPGTFFPGVIGAISLILALTALSALPVHYGALGLLVLGIALMIAEALTPGFGILGLGGLVAFIIGGIFLFEGGDSDIEIAVSLPLIIGFALTTAGFIFGILGAAMKARRRTPATGAEQMIGSRAEVVEWHESSGQVRLLGEIWAARGGTSLKPKDLVRVTGREGLTLIVES